MLTTAAKRLPRFSAQQILLPRLSKVPGTSVSCSSPRRTNFYIMTAATADVTNSGLVLADELPLKQTVSRSGPVRARPIAVPHIFVALMNTGV
jgi:hypothetical protein